MTSFKIIFHKTSPLFPVNLEVDSAVAYVALFNGAYNPKPGPFIRPRDRHILVV